ncbi:hypothetical protein BH11ARM2_BH11ARM2_06610 [soil metagenome]
MKALSILLACALAGPALAEERTYLNIGDPAPALQPAKWLKGTPVKTFEKGKVYVVEFWATWCGPCKENIPHLTELAKKYQGKVSVSGISIWENSDPEAKGVMEKVEAFVKKQGTAMDYNVAADGGNAKVANAWMKAADEGGIPCSFIIGRDGRIAWIGHPANLASVLDQVVQDKFDVATARERRALDVQFTRPVREAMDAKEYAKALSLMEVNQAQKPELERYYAYDRLVATFHTDPKKAMSDANAILASANGEIGAYQMVASIMASSKDLDPSVYTYAKGVIAKALEIGDRKYMFLAMNAEVLMSLGDKAGAVQSQEQAVKEAEGDTHAPKEFVEFLRKNLEKFKAALGS